MTSDKEKIIELFRANVLGRRSDISSSNAKHDGAAGHWLERRMNVLPNSDNAPDLLGYEMKNQTSSGKVTFGDWSANEYIFRKSAKDHNGTNSNYNFNRDQFLQYFGKPNLKKNGRFSWSGEPSPQYYEQWSTYGQVINIDGDSNIVIKYSFSQDTRENKRNILPLELQQEDLVLAKWYADSISSKVEKKFNQKGWFSCKFDSTGVYDRICFGQPIDYEAWLLMLVEGEVFFDSGMYQGNDRPYSQWRALSSIWDSLIVEEYGP